MLLNPELGHVRRNSSGTNALESEKGASEMAATLNVSALKGAIPTCSLEPV